MSELQRLVGKTITSIKYDNEANTLTQILDGGVEFVVAVKLSSGAGFDPYPTLYYDIGIGPDNKQSDTSDTKEHTELARMFNFLELDR